MIKNAKDMNLHPVRDAHASLSGGFQTKQTNKQTHDL